MEVKAMQTGKYLIGSTILTALFFTTWAWSQEKNENVEKIENKSSQKRITIEEFQKLVKEKLPEFRINRITVEKAKNDLYATKSTSDTSLTGSWQYFRNKEYSTGGTFSIDHSKGTVSSIGLSKLVAPTGTQLSVSMDYTRSSTQGLNSLNNETLQINQYQPALTLTVSQPILYNAFGMIDRYARNNARMQLEIEKIQKQENDKSTVTAYAKLYYQWILYSQVEKILNQSVKNAKAQEAQTIRKFRYKLADNDDVQKARASRIQYENQLEQYHLSLQTIKSELNLILPINQYDPDPEELLKKSDTAISYQYPDIAFEKTRSYKILKKTLQQIEYLASVNRNKLLPELNLIGSVSQKSSADSQSEALSGINDTEYYAGFSVSYPLGNHEARSALKDAQLSLQENRYTIQKSRNSYETQSKSLRSSALSYKKQIALYEEQIKTLQSQLYTETQKYKQARINLSYVISTRNDIYQSKIDQLITRTNAILTWLDYRDLIR